MKQRQLVLIVVSVLLLFIIGGTAYVAVTRQPQVSDFEASLSDCGDLYEYGSQAYKACLDSQ